MPEISVFSPLLVPLCNTALGRLVHLPLLCRDLPLTLHTTSLLSHKPTSWKAPSLLSARIQQMIIYNYEHFTGCIDVFILLLWLSLAPHSGYPGQPASVASVYLNGSTTFPLSRLKITERPGNAHSPHLLTYKHLSSPMDLNYNFLKI